MQLQTTDQIGVCSWSLQATSSKDLAEKVTRLGLKKVQLGLVPHREDPGAWADVGHVLADAGVKIVSGMYSTIGEDYTTPETIRRTGGVVLDDDWQENLSRAKDAANLAETLQLPYVSVHAGFLPHETNDPEFDKLASRVATLAEVFGDKNIVVLLETGQETAYTLLLFLDEIKKRGVSNLAVNFDPANMILYDMDDPIDALKVLAPHVRQVHVKDARRTRIKGEWGEEVVVGTGEVDWNTFVTILANHDFTGNYIFEREAGTTRIEDIAKGINLLSQVMQTLH